MTRDYLHQWAAQLCARYPQMGAIHDLGLMTASELTGLILFLENCRALNAMP
jgi:hypothetical protein